MSFHFSNKMIAGALFEGRSNTALDETQLRTLAPSIFAETKHESRSERFVYIPTWEAVRSLMAQGFEPVAAKQGNSRIEGKADFTKHVVRFRHNTAAMAGTVECVPEVLLMNAHDGTSSYRIMAGAFRPICKNGLVACETLVDDVKVGHVGNIVDKVVEGTWRVVADVHRVRETAGNWQQIGLNRDEEMILAEAAHEARFGDNSAHMQQAIRPAQMLAARRPEDRQGNLWHAFNRIQENAIRGGLSGYAAREDAQGRLQQRRATSRPVQNIDGENALNRALWVLTQRMAELKGAA